MLRTGWRGRVNTAIFDFLLQTPSSNQRCNRTRWWEPLPTDGVPRYNCPLKREEKTPIYKPVYCQSKLAMTCPTHKLVPLVPRVPIGSGYIFFYLIFLPVEHIRLLLPESWAHHTRINQGGEPGWGGGEQVRHASLRCPLDVPVFEVGWFVCGLEASCEKKRWSDPFFYHRRPWRASSTSHMANSIVEGTLFPYLLFFSFFCPFFGCGPWCSFLSLIQSLIPYFLTKMHESLSKYSALHVLLSSLIGNRRYSC